MHTNRMLVDFRSTGLERAIPNILQKVTEARRPGELGAMSYPVDQRPAFFHGWDAGEVIFNTESSFHREHLSWSKCSTRNYQVAST
ncbi:hypothetical protein GCM10011586_26710 [Silvibacterium dinghuense]|nr:hypothetical protein GCM10011586_26710 [Silvibacterium dinghuense]